MSLQPGLFVPFSRKRIISSCKDPNRQFLGQPCSFHQDHSSVNGLAAKEIDKTGEDKASSSKQHKQVVTFFPQFSFSFFFSCNESKFVSSLN